MSARYEYTMSTTPVSATSSTMPLLSSPVSPFPPQHHTRGHSRNYSIDYDATELSPLLPPSSRPGGPACKSRQSLPMPLPPGFMAASVPSPIIIDPSLKRTLLSTLPTISPNARTTPSPSSTETSPMSSNYSTSSSSGISSSRSLMSAASTAPTVMSAGKESIAGRRRGNSRPVKFTLEILELIESVRREEVGGVDPWKPRPTRSQTVSAMGRGRGGAARGGEGADGGDGDVGKPELKRAQTLGAEKGSRAEKVRSWNWEFGEKQEVEMKAAEQGEGAEKEVRPSEGRNEAVEKLEKEEEKEEKEEKEEEQKQEEQDLGELNDARMLALQRLEGSEEL